MGRWSLKLKLLSALKTELPIDVLIGEKEGDIAVVVIPIDPISRLIGDVIVSCPNCGDSGDRV